MTSHWTQESAKNFAYNLSLDFFTQLDDKFQSLDIKRNQFAKTLSLSAGRISQIFNSPPENPKLDSLVKYAQALGMKVSVVAYEDTDDPTNERGPIFSEIFSRCWERAGRPRDLISISAFNQIPAVTIMNAGNLLAGKAKGIPEPVAEQHLFFSFTQQFYRPVRRPDPTAIAKQLDSIPIDLVIAENQRIAEMQMVYSHVER
jgi:transcriptional regulator with XRE-family HTH domain